MTKKLYLSVMTLILVIISSSTATYAWLSQATSNAVKDISMTTHDGESLEISLDGMNYYTSLPSEVINQELTNLNFTDMTSFDGKDFNFGIRTIEFTPVSNKDYISLELYFRTESPLLHDVYLANNVSDIVTFDTDLNGTYITSKGRLWVSDIDFLYDEDEIMYKDESKRFYVKDAMRISVVNHESNVSKIFDLSGNEHRGYAKPYGAHAYYEFKRGSTQLPKAVPDTIYTLSAFDLKSPFALDMNSYLLTLKFNGRHADNGRKLYEGKVTMNIWVEGWDADLFDAVYGDQVKMKFQFKAVMGLKG